MRKSLAFALFFVLAAASFSAARTPDRSQTATGTISKIQASERTITVQLADGSESRFVWNADTKINGVLVTGARVTIRFDTAGDGAHLAQQISVARS